MKRSLLVATVTILAVASGCGGGSGDSDGPAPERTALGATSSVVELRDALVSAGYSCENWTQDDAVTLAAESGTCDDASVLSTFASDADKQEQLDVFRETESLFTDAGVELDPYLVGPNWIVRAPGVEDYAKELGGTVVR